MKRAPLVLSVAGFDPSGRAGLLADQWAIRRSGGSPIGAVSTVTAQGLEFRAMPVDPQTVEAQVMAAHDAGTLKALKLGAIPNRKVLTSVLSFFHFCGRPIVIDPVVRTSKGQSLSSLTPRDYLALGQELKQRKHLVLTPNREELAWLGVSPEELLRLGFSAVIVKGSESAIDEVFSANGRQLLRGTRLRRNTSHHRGTGCRFASAIATRLAVGDDLISAARSAKRLVRKFLSAPIIA